MNRLTIAATLAVFLSTPVLADDIRLEPAINGAVSADGRYASQAGQDWYQAQQRVQAEIDAEHRLALLHQADLDAELEPGINGAVSPSGQFASAELEEIAESLARPETRELLSDSVYLGATVDGWLPDLR